MNRRTFLRRSSALGALTLAGCIADDDTNGTNSGDTPTPDEPTSPEVVGSSIERTGKGCASAEHGQASASMNDSEMTVSFSGRIITATPCYSPTLESVEYDAESDTLTITVGAEQKDKVCVDCVGEVQFSGTVEFEGGLPGDVTIVHDGETLTAGSGSAEGSEETPTLQASSFSVIDISSSSPEHTADASFNPDEETVVVTGTIVGSNGCMTADVGDVNYDAESDQLSVDVVTTKRDDAGDVCTQQLVAIDYEATFSFDGRIPSSVSVSHDGQGVMSAGYGSSSASAPDSEA